MWLEQLARSATASASLTRFPSWKMSSISARCYRIWLVIATSDATASECARAFQRGIAQGIFDAATALCRANDTDTIVLSGGVFQNELLLEDLKSMLDATPIQVWTNHAVPANDGGISLGQAALAAFGQFDPVASTSLEGGGFA